MSKIYGDSVSVTKVPSISSAGTAYAAGDIVGGLQTLPCGLGANTSFSAGSPSNTAPVFLQSVTVVDKSNQSPEFDIVFFDAAPTLVADNAAAEFTDAQMGTNCLGVVTVDSYKTFSTNAVGTETNVGLAMQPITSGTVWAAVVCRTAVTMVNSSALTFKYVFSRDMG